MADGSDLWRMGLTRLTGLTFGGWVLRVAERSPNASAVKEGWGYSEPWRVLVTGRRARRALPAIPPLDSECMEADACYTNSALHQHGRTCRPCIYIYIDIYTTSCVLSSSPNPQTPHTANIKDRARGDSKVQVSILPKWASNIML